MPTSNPATFRTNFGGINNSKAPHLIEETEFRDLQNCRPDEGVLKQTKAIAKNYEAFQIRSNIASQLKVFEPIYDTTTSQSNYLCVSETQAWIQDKDALEQTTGTAAQNLEKAFDFSTDEDGLVGTNTVLSGNNDGVSDGSVSYDDCLKAYADATNGAHRIDYDMSSFYTATDWVRVKFSYYLPSTNTNVDNLRLLEAPAVIGSTTDTWVDVDIITMSADTTLRFALYSGASGSFVGANSPTDDLVYIVGLTVSNVTNENTPSFDPQVDQTEIPVLVKSASTTNTYTDQDAHCYIQGFNSTNAVTDFPSIGDTVEVEILSSTTFKITSSVSGVLGTGLTIAQSVPIPTTDYVVYFFDQNGAYDDYNVGDTWTYTRSELPYDSTYDGAPFSTSSYGYDVYISVSTNDIFRYRDGCLVNVGSHEGAVGQHVLLWENHLFVSQWDGEPFDLKWSDLNRPDLFLETFNNESSIKSFLYAFDSGNQTIGITGLVAVFDKLYVLFSSAIHQGVYVGSAGGTISFTEFDGNKGSIFLAGPVKSNGGFYFIANDYNIWFCDSSELVKMGDPVQTEFKNSIVEITDTELPTIWNFYNKKTEEVFFVYKIEVSGSYKQKILVYNEKEQAFYFRNIPNVYTDADNAEGDITSCALLFQNQPRLHWGAKNFFYRDYQQSDCRIADVLTDDISEAGVTPEIVPLGVIQVVPLGDIKYIPNNTPAAGITIETKDIMYSPLNKQTLDKIILDAKWDIGEEIEIYLSVRDKLSDPVVFNQIGTWQQTAKDEYYTQTVKGRQNVAGNIFRYRFKMVPTDGSNLVDGFELPMWGDKVHSASDGEEILR